MKFARPINDKTPNISNPFGVSHPGVDYAYVNGTPGYASADGVVIAVKKDETRQWIANTSTDPFRRLDGKNRLLITEDYGNYIMIDHGDEHTTLYAHHRPYSALVNIGDKVKRGQKIFEIGSTGNSTGNHLHWEVRKNNKNINPFTVLDFDFDEYFDPNSSQPLPGPTPVYQPINDQTKIYIGTNLKTSQDYDYMEVGAIRSTIFDQANKIDDLANRLSIYQNTQPSIVNIPSNILISELFRRFIGR